MAGAGLALDARYGRMLLWLKGLAYGFAAGTVTMSLVLLWSYLSDSSQPDAKSSISAAQAADMPTSPVARVQALAAEEGSAAGALDASPAPAHAVPAKDSRSSRADELAALDSARAALAARNPEAALAELERYEKNYPSLSFGQRAQLLRMEALSAAGRPQAARELASTYITTYPDSPHAAQLRAFVAGEAWAEQP